MGAYTAKQLQGKAGPLNVYAYPRLERIVLIVSFVMIVFALILAIVQYIVRYG